MDTKKEILLDMLDDVADKVKIAVPYQSAKNDIIELIKEIERFL